MPLCVAGTGPKGEPPGPALGTRGGANWGGAEGEAWCWVGGEVYGVSESERVITV